MIDYWFVQLVRGLRMPKWLVWAVLFSLLSTLFFAGFGVFTHPAGEPGYLQAVGTGLFFAFINAYTIVGGAYVIERTETALRQLAPLAHLSAEETDKLADHVRGVPTRWAVIVAVLAACAGIAHALLLFGGPAGLISTVLGKGEDIATFCGTVLTWFVITHVVVACSRNATLFARFGRDRVDLDLATPSSLAPFGTIALVPALGLVGTQVAYPLLSLEFQFNPVAVLPGFLVTLAALLYMFLRPTWPLHQRLRAAKAAEQARVEQDIHAWQRAQNKPLNDRALADLQPRLAYREYVNSLPVWPFDMPLIARWAFYLTIPPLTWVCAAFVEVFVERAI